MHMMNEFFTHNNTHINVLVLKFTTHDDRCVELVETASRVSVTWQNGIVQEISTPLTLNPKP
jgi:hypothetical protein